MIWAHNTPCLAAGGGLDKSLVAGWFDKSAKGDGLDKSFADLSNPPPAAGVLDKSAAGGCGRLPVSDPAAEGGRLYGRRWHLSSG